MKKLHLGNSSALETKSQDFVQRSIRQKRVQRILIIISQEVWLSQQRDQKECLCSELKLADATFNINSNFALQSLIANEGSEVSLTRIICKVFLQSGWFARFNCGSCCIKFAKGCARWKLLKFRVPPATTRLDNWILRFNDASRGISRTESADVRMYCYT